jgi:hypothetical protein
MILRVACSLIYFSKDGGLMPGQGQDVSHPVRACPDPVRQLQHGSCKLSQLRISFSLLSG